MCGIVGYIGGREAAGLLIDGLRRMEYRGYDSAGIAVVNGGKVDVRKAAGKLANLERAIDGNAPHGTLGIGHTRWATHGAPTTPNAHPHTDQTGKLALIHNGIIENAGSIRKLLVQRGHTFKSETDTEVLAHLVGERYEGKLAEAVAAALREVEGAYGIAVISADEPDVLVAARRGSPLLVGVGDKEWFVASDASAILAHTRSVVYLDDGEMAVLTREGYSVRDLALSRISKPVDQIDWDLATIERGGYDHFMLKEIFEQPET
ncbi:MAG: glutamine--fructose-6-phosphate transaminase (isomerizing), partial [Gemmatimonadales bacterium]